MKPSDVVGLKKAWDEYGHAKTFEELDGVKIRSDGCYCVVRWKEGDHVEVADLARGGRGEDWDMQNDGFMPIDEADWTKLRIVPECDWFSIKGNPDFPPLGDES